MAVKTKYKVDCNCWLTRPTLTAETKHNRKDSILEAKTMSRQSDFVLRIASTNAEDPCHNASW